MQILEHCLFSDQESQYSYYQSLMEYGNALYK